MQVSTLSILRATMVYLFIFSLIEIESYIQNDPAAAPVLTSLTKDIFFLTNCYKTSDLLASLNDIKPRIQSIIDRHTALMIQVNPAWHQCNTSHQKRLILRCCIETFLINRLYPMVEMNSVCDIDFPCDWTKLCWWWPTHFFLSNLDETPRRSDTYRCVIEAYFVCSCNSTRCSPLLWSPSFCNFSTP